MRLWTLAYKAAVHAHEQGELLYMLFQLLFLLSNQAINPMLGCPQPHLDLPLEPLGTLPDVAH
jgi:hypothetical protein